VAASAFQVVGFALAVTGVACWSFPAALIVAGVTLFITGGLEARR
jgi:hypothetical protein